MARLSPALVDAYAECWADNGINYALTLSLGFYPSKFEAEQFLPILRRLIREAACKLRLLPKRKALTLTPQDDRALFMAGFYEPTDRAGLLYPHWHGGVALAPREDLGLRSLLIECFGEDADRALGPLMTSETHRPLVTDRRAKPSFHLAPMTTPDRLIRYANKHTKIDDLIHWTTYDALS